MGLTFLTPMLLGGAALVAVPVVLHLLMRRKPVKREFPAMIFLRETLRANRRKLRVNNLLLLAMRAGAIALLALAFARPTLRGAGWIGDREAPVAAAFVFDTAPRMLLREGNRTRIERAVEMAQSLAGKLPKESELAVLDTSGGPRAFAPSMEAAAASIRRLSTATPAASLSSAVADALRLLESSGLARREIAIFTDLSVGGWADAEPPAEVFAKHPDVSVIVVDVGAERPRNFSIDAISLPGDRIAAGLPLVIGVSRSRTGPDATRSVAVEMRSDDGRFVRRAEKPGEWSEKGCDEITLEVGGLEKGTHQGRVVVTGSDDLEADDVRHFTVEVASPPKVLVAAAAPAARNAELFRQAIAPSMLEGTTRSRFDCVTVDVPEIEKAGWDDFAGMVLLDPPPLSERTWGLLESWVTRGKGLVVWLGPAAGAAGTFNSDASARLLGGRIDRVWSDRTGTNRLSPASLDHPILAPFRRVADAVPWQDFPVERHWDFRPNPPVQAGGGGPSSASVVAAYRDGLPAILEHRAGEGMVVIVTTPVSRSGDDADAWNMLATGFEPWPFVILASESLLHAIRSVEAINVVAGEPAIVRVVRREGQGTFVETPDGEAFPVAVDPERGTVTVNDTRVPGNYHIRSGGQADGLAKGFSANLAPAATNVSRLDRAVVAGLFGPSARIARTEDELVREVNLERVGAELYGWIIVLVAAFMAVDWILANRFYPPVAEAAS
jgi:hypothetical protein